MATLRGKELIVQISRIDEEIEVKRNQIIALQRSLNKSSYKAPSDIQNIRQLNEDIKALKLKSNMLKEKRKLVLTEDFAYAT